MEVLPKVYYHLDEPTADGCAIAVYFLSRLAAKDLKVVLSGEGADEFFGGYNSYDDNFYTALPLFVLKFETSPLFPFSIKSAISAVPHPSFFGELPSHKANKT